jgi:dehydrogenase/reductase SDR family protein 1
VPLACDYADDASVADAVDQIRQEHEGLDLLVNNVFAILDEASFIGAPFWEQSLDNRDRMHHVGLRSHYVASAACARMPIERRGLIVTISSFGARSFQLSTASGVGKAGCDKLARDMAAELEPRGVCSLALYPGIVRTERILVKQDELPFALSKSESAEFTGRVVAALLGGPERLGSRGSRARRRPCVDSAHHGLDPSQQARRPSADGYGH